MAFKVEWNGDENDSSGSISELLGAVGLFYVALLCLGLVFVKLEQAQRSDSPAVLARTPHAALLQALRPFDGGR